MYIPVYPFGPLFYYIKVWFKVSILYRHVFVTFLCVSGGLCFVIEAFPGYIYLYISYLSSIS